MATQEAQICDAATARDETLKLLAIEADRRVLVVSKHAERPISELIFCHRKCTANPTREESDLVRALSGGQDGVRAFSGESCHHGEYIGNNIWGRGFDKKTTYCQVCGFALTGPQIDHVIIVRSEDEEWNRKMIEQCEIGAYWHEGENLGLTYEVIPINRRGLIQSLLSALAMPFLGARKKCRRSLVGNIITCYVPCEDGPWIDIPCGIAAP